MGKMPITTGTNMTTAARKARGEMFPQAKLTADAAAEPVKLCRDCLHVRPADSTHGWECGRFTDPPRIDLVTGALIPPVFPACAEERYAGSVDCCGFEGRYWWPGID